MKSILSYLARIFPLVLLCSMALAQTPAAKPQGARVAPEIMSVSELHRGMRGVAYTVFEGTKPEPMDSRRAAQSEWPEE